MRDIPFAFLAALMACPKALKSNFSLFCFIVISPSYILLFLFSLRYDYTYHSMDRNKAYYKGFDRINTVGMYIDKTEHFDYTEYIPNE